MGKRKFYICHSQNLTLGTDCLLDMVAGRSQFHGPLCPAAQCVSSSSRRLNQFDQTSRAMPERAVDIFARGRCHPFELVPPVGHVVFQKANFPYEHHDDNIT